MWRCYENPKIISLFDLPRSEIHYHARRDKTPTPGTAAAHGPRGDPGRLEMKREILLACAAGACLAAGASAQVFTISIADGNSGADFDVISGGQVNWFVDGLDQLFNQDFYYRAGMMQDEASVTTAALVGAVTTDTNPFSDPRHDTLSVLYRDLAAGLEFEIRYGLSGGTPGSRTADLAEQIIIRNLLPSANAVSFFQYVDFDLGRTSGSDMGWIDNGRVANQVDTALGISVTETVVVPAPSHFSVGNFPTIINQFFDGLPTTLDDNAGPVFGDVTWAFQWDIVIDGGGSFLISKDKLITPAPASLALVGLAGLFGARRRRA